MKIVILLIFLGELLLTGCAFFTPIPEEEQTTNSADTPTTKEQVVYPVYAPTEEELKEKSVNYQRWSEIEENDTFFSSKLEQNDYDDSNEFVTLIYFVDKNNCNTGILTLLDMTIVIYNKQSLYSNYIDVLKVNNKNVKFNKSSYTYLDMGLAKPTSYKGRKYLEDQFLYKKRVVIKNLKGEVISTYNANGFSKMRRAMIKVCKINNKNINNAL